MSDQPEWRKSSYSGGREACVEVADLVGATALRDSKNPGVAALTFPEAEWHAFVRGLQRGDFQG
ncbi:DUF397 domain-containing protein [Nocardiopsis gilva YIM 90087]|uniref:DUF397 domain-containing protein n=1 Tax=Nocardiopsis gilva YIM 90087 TaxID=1235441 RepID=A0A223SAH5_9ACTN|nr:DUF397 domain-containing protein [Nocardiopsis gilva]ASU85127.1 DUF397 domain-containing protein [Nocardiopsis gilva YIM 90087]